MQEESRLVTMKQLLELLHCTKPTLYLWIRKKGFPAHCKSYRNNLLWDLKDVKEYYKQFASIGVSFDYDTGLKDYKHG